MSMFDVSRASVEIGESEISFETGKLAKQASGSVVVRSGDTMVLCTATMGNLRDVDFLPLTVDVEERMYAAGKIPGSFFRREGRSGEKATLTARMIDRPIRPLFPKGWHFETQIVATPMSVDHEHPYDILAMNGASAALAISQIPVAADVGAVRIGKLDGDFVVNPDEESLDDLDLDLIVAGTDEAILMVEAGASGVTEAEILDALDIAHGEIKKLVAAMGELREKAGKEKLEVEAPKIDESLTEQVRSEFGAKIDEATSIEAKLERQDAVDAVEQEVLEKYAPADDAEADPERRAEVAAAFAQLEKEIIRRRIAVDKKRPDARSSARWTSHHACTAPRSSPAGRRRSSPTRRSGRRAWTCASTRSGWRRRSASGTTTTSRRSRWGRPASCAARSAATSAMARSPSERWWPRCRTRRASRM
jgi:polyribonucleotide nucleotidyltransferase